MNWNYLMMSIAIAAVIVVLRQMAARVPDRRDRNDLRLALDLPADGRHLGSIESDQASVCILCNCQVVDDVTHWKTIHHVPG